MRRSESSATTSLASLVLNASCQASTSARPAATSWFRPVTTSQAGRYEWLDPTVPLAPVPDWLHEPSRLGADPPERSLVDGGPTPYGLAALRGEIEILLRTPVGRRNDQLNRSAFALGRLIASGHLGERLVRTHLRDAALSIGLGAYESFSTIQSGLDAGSSC